MPISIGGYSTLLFGVGLVALVASCLQIVVYTKAAQELRQLASRQGGSLDWVYGSSISPVVVVHLSIIVSSMTLVVTTVFTGLDLVGMIVLRSRMWRHFSTRNAKQYMASACGQAWWPPLAPNASLGQWPAESKGYDYDMAAADMTIAWWQRWVFLEDLVFAIQRNLAFIRLAAAMLLAMLWAPTVVQLVIVSMAGRCHTVARSAIADEEAVDACDLMRKGTIGAIATWACWTVLAALLVSFNTNPRCSPPQLSSLPFVRVPMPNVGCDFSGCRTSISLPLGQKQQQQHPYKAKGGVMPPVQQVLGQMAQQQQQQQQQHFGGYQAYQHKPQHGPTSGSAGQKKLPSSSYRSSWSYMDKGSSMADSCKGDTQSNKTNAHLHSQNMVHQFYHLQNQQFQSLHQIQQASRMSEERLHLRQQQQLASHKAVQRQLSLTLQEKSMYSSVCTASEQSLDAESVPTTKAEVDSTTRMEGGGSSLQLQRQHLQMLQQGQQAHVGDGLHRPVRGVSVSGERTSQSLVSFAHHNPSPEPEERDGDKASKRNTIG